jgi:uncharacterized protein YceK
MKYLTPALVAVSMLSGCGSALSSFLPGGGGPNVSANVQAGQTNTQTIGTTEVSDQTITRPRARSIEQSTGETRVRTEYVERIEVHEVDWRYVAVIAGLAGLLIPSPGEIAARIRGLFTRRSEKPA